jgi:Fe-Mn family superoxide dismutase
MQKFEERKFNIPKLKGISEKTIEEHLKLYAGYVKNANLIFDHIDELSKDPEKYAYELGELHRRFAFEFGGMRNHEYYFSAFEDGPALPDTDGLLYKAVEDRFGDFENWLKVFKQMAGTTRGIGWAMLYYDQETEKLLNQWVDEQHLNHLPTCKIILPLDMWEHSYVADYQPSGKKNYIEDFFANLNWQVIEQNYENASGEEME